MVKSVKLLATIIVIAITAILFPTGQAYPLNYNYDANQYNKCFLKKLATTLKLQFTSTSITKTINKIQATLANVQKKQNLLVDIVQINFFYRACSHGTQTSKFKSSPTHSNPIITIIRHEPYHHTKIDSNYIAIRPEFQYRIMSNSDLATCKKMGEYFFCKDRGCGTQPLPSSSSSSSLPDITVTRKGSASPEQSLKSSPKHLQHQHQPISHHHPSKTFEMEPETSKENEEPETSITLPPTTIRLHTMNKNKIPLRYKPFPTCKHHSTVSTSSNIQHLLLKE